MLSACRLRPSSVSSGKNSQPWRLTNQPAKPARALRDDAGRERDRTRTDVGVVALEVGTLVVHGVLVAPPREAQPGEGAGEDAGGPRVPLARGEHLPVCGVVAEEAELRDDDAERSGEDQLEPRVAEQEEPHPDREERRDVRADLQPVVAVLALEEPGVLDVLHQLGEVADVLLIRCGLDPGLLLRHVRPLPADRASHRRGLTPRTDYASSALHT